MTFRRRRRNFFATVGVIALTLSGVAACSEIADENLQTHQIVIASGGKTGVYYSYGQHLAEMLAVQLERDVSAIETQGSIDNLLRVSSGLATFGFTQSDAAADSIHGVGAFSEPVEVRAVAKLYDEYVHLVVREDSEIERVSDLRNHAVSLGSSNSGVNVVATRIVEAAGLNLSELDNRRLNLEFSISALERGEIDAFFWVGGAPTPGISDLINRVPIRLIPIQADTVDAIHSEYPGVYRFADLPLSAYGWETPIETLAVPNYLITSAHTDEQLVYAVLEQLFEHRSELAFQVAAVALLDHRSAIYTNEIELHDGAVRYYQTVRR